MRHHAEEHFVSLVNIIDDPVDSVYICLYLFLIFQTLILVLLIVLVMSLLLYVVFVQIFPLQFTMIMMQVQVLILLFLFHQSSTFPSSTIQPPSLELKSLPEHLKYAYLDYAQKLPVIISSSLSLEHEDKLLHVLRGHKKAIGWTLVDLPRINPSICMHRILLDDDSRLVRQPKRRLNPTILDVVMKEVMKLLAAGIIYPI